MVKVETIEQFKVLQHIKENFFTDNIKVTIVGKDSLKVTDSNHEYLIFRWDGTKVITVDQ